MKKIKQASVEKNGIFCLLEVKDNSDYKLSVALSSDDTLEIGDEIKLSYGQNEGINGMLDYTDNKNSIWKIININKTTYENPNKNKQ